MGMIAMGSALGTGLFLGSGTAISVAGPGVILSFMFGSFLAIIIALAMGEMASRYPVSGGFGTLAAYYLSPYWGYLARWLYWVVSIAVTGAELVACAHYLQLWFPEFPLWAGVAIFAAIVIGVNVVSVNSFGVIEFFLSSIKVIAVLVFILLGLLLVFFGFPSTPAVGLGNLVADAGFLPFGLTGVWIAMSYVMFSFGGIELLSISAAEAQDPARSIRTAAQNTVIRLSCFYVLAVSIVVALVPWRSAASLGEDVQHSPFVLVFQQLGVPAAAIITNLIVLIAALSAANAMTYSGSRFLHSLAMDSLVPAVFAKTSSKGVPLYALAGSVTGIILTVLLAISGIADLFPLLMSVVVFSVILVWVLILVTYLAYFRRRDGQQLFNLPGGKITAWIGLFGLVIVFATVLVVERMQIAAAVGIPFVLLVSGLYLVVFRHRVSRRSIQRAIDLADAARRNK